MSLALIELRPNSNMKHQQRQINKKYDYYKTFKA